jgi:hypothetical protein
MVVIALFLGVFACGVLAVYYLIFVPNPFLFPWRQQNPAFQKLAEAVGGTWIAGTAFRFPEVHFGYRGQLLRLDSQGFGYTCFVHTRLTGLCLPACQALRCEITSVPKNTIPPWRRIRGPEIPAGPPELQTAFRVRGNDPARIARSLTLPVAEALIELLGEQVQGNPVVGCVSVEMAGGQMEIRKEGFVTAWQELEKFVRLGLKLHAAWAVSVRATGEPLPPPP